MKKITTLILIAICFCSSLLFTACNKSNSIDMNVYFSESAEAKIYGESQADNILLGKLTGNSPYETKKYTQTTLKSTSWFYGMYVETISFYIYSTETREVEFDFILTGIEHGMETLSSTTKDLRITQYPCALKENEGYKVTITVNDKIYLSSSSSVLTIKPTAPTTEFENSNFAYCIYGMEVVSYHK